MGNNFQQLKVICLGPSILPSLLLQAGFKCCKHCTKNVSSYEGNCRYEREGGLTLSGKNTFQAVQHVLGLLCDFWSLNNVNTYKFSFKYEIHIYEYEKKIIYTWRHTFWKYRIKFSKFTKILWFNFLLNKENHWTITSHIYFLSNAKLILSKYDLTKLVIPDLNHTPSHE